MQNKIEFEVPKSFGLNQEYKNRYGKSLDYKALYEQAYYASRNIKLETGIFDFTFYLKKAMDADNTAAMIKCILDAFKKSGALQDDNKINVSEIRTRVISPVKNRLPYVHIVIL